MLIIPAIDLKDGRCVRLFQGDLDQETVYFEDPVAAAKHWVGEGATFLHIVDLNGAVEGRPVHTKEVAAICAVAGLSVELGGGLRSVEAVQAALGLGVSRVVIGTAAYDNALLLQTLCKKFPGKIVAGINCRTARIERVGGGQSAVVQQLTQNRVGSDLVVRHRAAEVAARHILEQVVIA